VEDHKLVLACIRGEARAWDDLVTRYGPVVYDASRFVLRRTLGSAQVEDIENIVQGVLLGLCDKECHRLRSFQGRSSFKTWITSVTARFALNYVRTEKRKGSLKYFHLDESSTDLPEQKEFVLMPSEERDRLLQAMGQIPDRDRLLLKLLYFDGLSYREIAQVLRMPLNSISPVLSRARESLKRYVETP
jgi:RNA polymerase sigma-70 factor (ECF subfamily)